MLHIDCSNGASGDMIVGALLDLGISPTLLEDRLGGIAHLKVSKVKKRGVAATDFSVEYTRRDRSVRSMLRVVKSLKLSKRAEALTTEIIKTLAEAEARIHKIPTGRLHLHEAADIIVDAAAASILLEELGWHEVSSSVVAVGRLAPATEYIIKKHSIPTVSRSDAEITTPTGAAILANIARSYGQGRGHGLVGKGAGDKNFTYSNVLTATLTSDLLMLESNIDDCTPETLSYAVERLMEEGALDAHVMPCIMKKGRLGFLFRVLTDRPKVHSKIMMQETGTLGVRVHPIAYRFESQRRAETVRVKFGSSFEEVSVKLSEYCDKPEFEDLKRIAKKHKIPLKDVRERVMRRLSPKT
ncbi:MAG: LarC family nickel insertion protein [Candidatus Altiarchaeota archaeon]